MPPRGKSLTRRPLIGGKLREPDGERADPQGQKAYNLADGGKKNTSNKEKEQVTLTRDGEL